MSIYPAPFYWGINEGFFECSYESSSFSSTMQGPFVYFDCTEGLYEAISGISADRGLYIDFDGHIWLVVRESGSDSFTADVFYIS